MGEEDDSARYEGPAFPGAGGMGGDGGALGGNTLGGNTNGNGMANGFGSALNGIGDASTGAAN